MILELGESDITEAVDCCGNFKKGIWLLGHVLASYRGSIFDHYSKQQGQEDEVDKDKL